VVVFFVLPTAFLSGNSSLIGTVVLCLLLTILLGFTLVAAGALPLLQGLIMWLLAGVLGLPPSWRAATSSGIAAANTTTALLFILSVSLVIFVASLVVAVQPDVNDHVEHFNGADLRLESDDAGALGLKTELAGVKGVERVSEVRLLRSRTERGTAYDVV